MFLNTLIIFISSTYASNDLSVYINNRDFLIQNRKVHLINNHANYNINTKNNRKFFTSIDKKYNLITETATNSKISRIIELDTHKTPTLLGRLGSYYTRQDINREHKGVVSNFDSNGNLESRLACKLLENYKQGTSYPIKTSCQHITKNRCKNAILMNQEIESINDQVKQCVNISRKLEALDNDNDLKTLKNNINILRESASGFEYLRKRQDGPIEHQKKLLARYKDLLNTISLCEKYMSFAPKNGHVELSNDIQNVIQE